MVSHAAKMLKEHVAKIQPGQIVSLSIDGGKVNDKRIVVAMLQHGCQPAVPIFVIEDVELGIGTDDAGRFTIANLGPAIVAKLKEIVPGIVINSSTCDNGPNILGAADPRRARHQVRLPRPPARVADGQPAGRNVITPETRENKEVLAAFPGAQNIGNIAAVAQFLEKTTFALRFWSARYFGFCDF